MRSHGLIEYSAGSHHPASDYKVDARPCTIRGGRERSNGPKLAARTPLIYPLPPQSGSGATGDGKFASLGLRWLITRKCTKSVRARWGVK